MIIHKKRFLLLCYLSFVDSFRVPVTDACIPFLCSDDTNSKVHWGSGRIALHLHNSDMVDIRSEGIRFITSTNLPTNDLVSSTTSTASACEPDMYALCTATTGSKLLPSKHVKVTSAWGVGGVFEAAAASSIIQGNNSTSNSAICSAAGLGVGREFTSEHAVYDISICDILASRYNLVYLLSAASDSSNNGTFSGNNLTLLNRPIGIMVYTLVLLLCSCNLGGIAQENPRKGITVLFLITSAFSLAISIVIMSVHKDSIITPEDEIYCAFTVTAGVVFVLMACASMTSLYKASIGITKLTQGACIHALDSLVCAVYSSPENPYSLIFSVFLCARLCMLIHKTIAVQSDAMKRKGAGVIKGTAIGFENVVENTLCVAHLTLLSEMGVYPQLVLKHSWPALASTSLYLSSVSVKLLTATTDYL